MGNSTSRFRAEGAASGVSIGRMRSISLFRSLFFEIASSSSSGRRHSQSIKIPLKSLQKLLAPAPESCIRNSVVVTSPEDIALTVRSGFGASELRVS
jgi:hypothetical protein